MPDQVPEKWIITKSDKQAIKDGCYWDQAAVDYVLDFFKTFIKQSIGQWGGQPLELLPWQVDLIHRLHGWKNPDGFRRHRFCYVEIAKKNGKSTLISALTLFHLVADNEMGAQCYLAAVDRDQAKTIFNEAFAMMSQSPELSEILTHTATKNLIEFPATFSKLVAITGIANSNEGKNISFCCIDELHAHKNRLLFDALRYGGSSRTQPLFFCITTAGSNRQTICYEQHQHAKRVLSGEVIDTSFLPLIFAADPSDDLMSVDTWRKANPSLGTTINLKAFEDEAKQARNSASSWATFCRYRLNLWVSSEFKFIPRDKWDGCKGKIDRERLRGRRCWAGGDLSHNHDTTCFVILFDTGEILPFFWLPRSEIGRNPNFAQWEEDGHLIVTEGDIVDYVEVKKKIEELYAEFYFEDLFLDPYNATMLASELQSTCNVTFYRQGMLSMTAPTKSLERHIHRKEITHDGNPLMAWQAENAVVRPDNSGNIKIVKATSNDLIDGMIALVMAIAAREASM